MGDSKGPDGYPGVGAFLRMGHNEKARERGLFLARSRKPRLRAYFLHTKEGSSPECSSRSTTEPQCSLLGGPFLLLPRWVFTALRRLRYSSGWLCLRYSMISKSSFFTRLRSSFST